MGRKEEQQDVESFTIDINNGGQQHKTQAQAQSSNGAPAAGKNDKAGSLNHHSSFRGGKRHGEAVRKTSGPSKGIGKTHKKSSIQKREKKKRLRKMEAFVSKMRSQMGRAERMMIEGKATVQKLKALNAQKREENKMQLMMNLWGQLVADEIELYIFP